MGGQERFEYIWVDISHSSAVIDTKWNINHDLGSTIVDPISTDTQVYVLDNNP